MSRFYGLVMTKADPEFVCLCVYQWSGERGQTILDKATLSTDDRKKWEKHLEKVDEQCKPRGSKLVAATQYKVLTQGYMELPDYIEKCRRITDACGWPEEAKDMALGNAILLGLRNPNVYQKCVEEDQDSLTAERVIQIATLIYNMIAKDRLCRLSVRRRRQLQPSNKGQRNYAKSKRSFEKAENRQRGPNKGKTPKAKEQEGTKRQSCFCCGQRLPTPSLSVRQSMSCATGVVGKATTRSVVKAKWFNPAEPWNTNRLKFMACRRG